jgi:uncharacterized protein
LPKALAPVRLSQIIKFVFCNLFTCQVIFPFAKPLTGFFISHHPFPPPRLLNSLNFLVLRAICQNPRSLHPLKTYTIPYVSLAEGNHNYQYVINNTFFDLFNHNIYAQANLNVALQVQKQNTLITLLFQIDGNISVNCDICLDEFALPVSVTKAVLVKPTGTNPDDADEDEIIIAQNDTEINVAQHIYDFITLAIPLKNVHPLNAKGEPTCNEKTLKEMQQHIASTQKENNTDPRWDKLKGLQ